MNNAVQVPFRVRFQRFINSKAGGITMLATAVVLLVLLSVFTGVSAQRATTLIVRGILLGGILALGAVGVSLIYGVLDIPNFAHGDMMTVSAFLGMVIIQFLPHGTPIGPFSFGYELIVALVLVIVFGGVLGYVLDIVAFRRLRRLRRPAIMFAMTSLGAAFGIRSFVYLIWGADAIFVYPGRARPAIELFWGIRVRPDQLFILGVALLLIWLMYLLLEKTKMGKAMRATADNEDLARVTGIDTSRVVLFTWLIGGGLAAAAGLLYGVDSQLRAEMGWTLLLPLFASVILGTIGNAYGALVGGFIIGIVWQLSSAFISPTYGPGAAFVVMILVLLIRPEGLFGKRG